MHELGIMNEILKTAIGVAEKNSGKKVTKITLRIGAMSGVVPRICASMLEVIAEGTIAEGCEVVIEEVPAVFKCIDCGAETSYDEPGPEYKCHACGSETLRLVAGHKFQLVNVGII